MEVDADMVEEKLEEEAEEEAEDNSSDKIKYFHLAGGEYRSTKMFPFFPPSRMFLCLRLLRPRLLRHQLKARNWVQVDVYLTQ